MFGLYKKYYPNEKQNLEKALDSPVADEELIAQIELRLSKAYEAEEAFWKQLSRNNWLTLGDRNTGFFHAVAKKRKKINAFTVIKDENGSAYFEEKEIASVIAKYYKALFTSDDSEIADTVDVAIFPQITAEMNEDLTSILLKHG